MSRTYGSDLTWLCHLAAQVKEVMLDSANQSISALKASLAAAKSEAAAAQASARQAEAEVRREEDVDMAEVHRLR